MQNLTISEIISNIQNRICFEATFNNSFQIKILEYVPFVCAAIHNGHHLRTELERKCNLTQQERYYEEDPFTGEFIKSLSITLIGNDSRYEYDLNRPEEECIYETAWDKEIWNTKLTKKAKPIKNQRCQPPAPAKKLKSAP
jgi:N-formylglutamate amidohydrolase